MESERKSGNCHRFKNSSPYKSRWSSSVELARSYLTPDLFKLKEALLSGVS